MGMHGDLPLMMKAGVLHAINDIRCEAVPTPEPGPGEAIVRVRACGICGSDVARVFETGMYNMPDIPGHEFAGEVAAVGSGVTDVSLGDAVAVIPLVECGECPSCLVGEYSQCDNYDYLGSRSPGGFAEYVKAPAKNLVRLPPSLDAEAGAFTEVMAVALHALRRTGGLRGGERVGVFGAGTVGLLAAQWAKVLGAQSVCCVDVIPSKLELAQRLGVDLCINARASDVSVELSEWTHGKGVQVAIEASGANAALAQAITSASKGGKLVLVGRQEQGVQLEAKTFEAILRRQLNIFGTWAWSRLPKSEWETVLAYASQGAIQTKPLISHRYTITQVQEAFQMIAAGQEPYLKVLFVFP